MNLFPSSFRAMLITVDGAKEAVMTVAERVARRVQVTKLQLEAQEAEERLRQAHESLGQRLHTAYITLSPDQTQGRMQEGMIEGALPLCEDIRAEHQALQAIRNRLASRQDDTLSASLLHFQDDLHVGGGDVARVTIASHTRADGARLCKMALVEGVRIVLIRRNDDILVPSEHVVLQAGDQVTVIGARSALPGAVHALLAPLP